MRPTTYYKLATRCPRTLTFKDGKRGHPTEAAARATAKAPGTYRISTVQPDGTRTDGEPFTVGAGTEPDNTAKPRRAFPTHATRPFGGRPH